MFEETLRKAMDRILEELGQDPRLIYLYMHMAVELREATLTGDFKDMHIHIRAVRLLAKEMGATDAQLQLILPQDFNGS